MAKTIVITGGPGIGKTTVISELAKRGYKTLPEQAEIIIAEHQAKGKEVIQENLQEEILKRQIKNESAVSTYGGLVFLDRGIIDNLAYCKHFNIEIPDQLSSINLQNRYDKVIMLDPLPTYVNSEIRIESKEESSKLHNLIEEAYQNNGYDVIKIPVLKPKDRAQKIIESIDQLMEV